MQYFPAALERLTEQFGKLPGIGPKTAQRLAFHLLSLPEEEANAFAQAVLEAKRCVKTCPVCQNLTDQDLTPAGITARFAWWRRPGIWRPWSGPGSTGGCTMCSTG